MTDVEGAAPDRQSPMALSGLVTRPALLARGLGDVDIGRAVRRGTLVRVARGVYRQVNGPGSHSEELDEQDSAGVKAAGRSGSSAGESSAKGKPRAPVGEPTPDEKRMAEYRARVRAVGLRGGDPLISHASAAALYRLPLPRKVIGPVHVTDLRAAGGQRRGSVFRHPGRSSAGERRIGGIRVTSPARTLVDLARTTDFRTAVTAIDRALHTSLVGHAELAAEMAAAAGRSGVRVARAAVSFADARTESAGESLTRVMLSELGFPPPELQVSVRDATGRSVARVDFGYLDSGLLIEFDGLVKYGGLADGPDARTALIEEKRREDRIRALGFVVLRLTWRDVLNQRRLRGLMIAAIEQATAATAAGLITGSLVPTARR